MFDIGFWEVGIIGVIALLVVGPEKLPGLAREAGRWVGRAQRMAGELKAEIEREADFQELKKLRDEIENSEIKTAARDLKATLSERISLDSQGSSSEEESDSTAAPESADGSVPAPATDAPAKDA